jgi:hypothetical protein
MLFYWLLLLLLLRRKFFEPEILNLNFDANKKMYFFVLKNNWTFWHILIYLQGVFWYLDHPIEPILYPQDWIPQFLLPNTKNTVGRRSTILSHAPNIY